jgi:glutathione S-transferase
LWPAEPHARAHARAVAAEMHAGFVALRRSCPMNMWRTPKRLALTPEVTADVARIDALWTDCRTRFGRGGPFLFGAFGAADAMYAPVVSRFHTYLIDVGPVSRAYMDAMMSLSAWTEWREAALKETWVLPRNEPDWPAVPRDPRD